MTINRREFSKLTMGAGALLATAGPQAVAGSDTLLRKAIPSSGEEIPIVGVGTNRYGVGDDAELRAPLKAALRKFHELGGTVVDTAPGYRTSEVVLGDLTSELGIVDDLFMATKVDVEGGAESARRMERSLSNLQRPSMDLMQVHDFIGWQDSIPLMQDWKQAGRIRYIGITTSRVHQYDVMEQVMREHELDFIQVNYSLANQRTAAERLLPLAADRGMAVLVNRPFGGGGVFKALSQAAMPGWAADYDVSSWAQFLLKFVVSHPAVTCAIPGMTKARHVEDNFGAAEGALPTARARRQMETFFDAL